MNDKLQLLEKQNEVREKGKVNFYSLIWKKKKVSDNCSIALPENINKEFLGYICDCLKENNALDSQKYNPMESSESVYEYLNDESLDSKMADFISLNDDASDMDTSNSKKLQNSNLLICDLEYEGNRYYIFMSQIPCEQLFKGKKAFIIGDGKIESITNKFGFFLSFSIDCVWRFEKNSHTLFVFNRKNFSTIFDYEEHLKKIVLEKKEIIENLNFIDTADTIIAKISQKNVYRNLAKIIDDAEYLKAMKEIKPKELRKRLLEKSSEFIEDDFDNAGKLIVTDKSYKKIVKMICKGFKYNFIQDRAENI